MEYARKALRQRQISGFRRRKCDSADTVKAQVKISGTMAVLTIRRILSKIFVWVSSETSSALVDTGEHRSPKNTPERIAPPVRISLHPIAFCHAQQITPMVAAVPNAVPVRTDTRQFKRNAIKIITDGFISPAQ